MGSVADRCREYRARLKAGRAVLAIEVDEIGLGEVLARNGFLQSSDADRDEICVALERAIAIWIEAEK